MRSRHMRGTLAIAGVAGLLASFWTVGAAKGESRRFAVMLAHSPKTFLDGAGQPGLPPGGLFSVATINKDYFDRIDPNVDSFAEYWSEISYGDVEVSGDAFGWVTVPWAFEPNPPSGGNRPSPVNFINLHVGVGAGCGPADPVTVPFAYGAGEEFCDCLGIGGPTTTISLDKCGALIIIDLTGNNPNAPAPDRGPGLDDRNAVEMSVWTPGERFVDLDGDNRWDGLDERNDQMCHGPNGCAGDPAGSGPRGCEPRGCGDLPQPCVDFNGDNACVNCNNCVNFEYQTCDAAHRCPGQAACVDFDGDGTFECTPANCVPPVPDCDLELPECCNQEDRDQRQQCVDDGGVLNGVPGLTCGTPILCCEFFDANGDNRASVVEPFEDFMIRYEPAGTGPSTVWVKVTDEYVRNNYPGDVDALIRRTGNGYYDPPDLFFDAGTTKMMQDAGNNRFAWRTPKPGARYAAPPMSEQPWFDQAWTARYGSTPPPWPGGTSADPPRNSPIMRPFDPRQPVPPVARGTSGRRWIKPNKGGWNGKGSGTFQDPNLPLGLGTDNPTGRILPEEVFGYYDGWVEHDDLPSSIYHHAGDKRLGEITSPTTDTVAVPGTGETYTAIFGVDIGPHDPNNANRVPDTFCVAAGPGAFNIHGEKGFDAGDVCIVEWLTWRTNGLNPTIATRWEIENVGDNGGYHPFAGPSSPRQGTDTPNMPHGPIGFRDYNLDGMIDQGEVRVERSENYSVDSDPSTPNDGTNSRYPFNRRRLVEDVVEALDPSVNWNDYLYQNRVSGIVLTPPNSYRNDNLFPLAPGFYPINTRDRLNLPFHDLATCQDCRDFPSAIAYTAHEYLHAWQHLPDLYDYQRLEATTADEENCPVGRWDIMADGGLVHPTAILKENIGWIRPVDLESLLSPGVEKVITLPPAEFVRDESYYYLRNSALPGEQYWFWSAGAGFDERLPGKGMIIMHTDGRTDPLALPLQQATPPFNYLIVQADGRSDLEACSSTGNNGDASDVWPGTSNARQFDFNTNPSASWTTPTRWTGLAISDIQPDGFGSIRLTLTFTPTDIPSLRFINPPGGESVGVIYQARFEATDLFGGTKIELYHTTNPASLVTDAAHLVGSLLKSTPGTIQTSLNWNLTNITNGRYYLFGKLIPGAGSGGSERAFTAPRAGRNNVGNGGLTVNSVDISNSLTSKARLETWTAVCTQADGAKWRVNSTLTQPPPLTGPDDAANRVATTGQQYTSVGGEVKFTITAGSIPFTLGDTFNFTTTGITAPSQGVFVEDHKIFLAPKAVILATPLSGPPPLKVDFDARLSVDPNGQPLAFRWDFGDGSAPATGAQTSHTYPNGGTFSVTLKATNQATGRFGEATVDIQVTNNSPDAVIKAAPTSGAAPLEVHFNATQSRDTETSPDKLIYQWNFGDGLGANDAGTPGVLSEVDHSYSRVNTNLDATNCTTACPCTATGRACTATCPCTFTAVLTVTDAGGKQDTDSLVIRVGNSNPTAKITTIPTLLQGLNPLTVTFNAKDSTDAEGDTLEVEWQWGDGSAVEKWPAKTGKPPAVDGSVPHTFTLPAGTSFKPYTVKAIVRDPKGGEATAQLTVTVFSAESLPPQPNRPPSAVFVVTPAEAFEGEEVTFDASLSSDPDEPTGDELRYRWIFGDGSPLLPFTTSPVATHTYATVGTYVVRLTVRDKANASSESTQTVRVLLEGANRSPVAMIATGPRTGAAPLTLTFDGSISFDPDGDVITSYIWEFGQDDILVETIDTGLVPEVTRVFATPGQYTVVLVVKTGVDGAEGRTAPESIVVTEPGAPPPPEPPPPRPEPQESPNSAAQRPIPLTCGLGVLTSFLGSLLGLTLTVVTRRRLKT